MENTTINLQNSLIQTYEEIIKNALEIFPNAVAFLSLLILGWVLAHTIKIVIRKIFHWFNSLFQKNAHHSNRIHTKNRSVYSNIIERITFWAILLFFFAAASNLLGLKIFSGLLKESLHYLPNLVTGIFIISFGFFIGNLVKTALLSADKSISEDSSLPIAQIVQFLIIFSAIIIGTEQIGLNVQLLSNLLMLALGVLLAGGALAFGLGAKTLVANIIGSQYIRKHCRLGETITLCIIKGSILEIN